MNAIIIPWLNTFVQRKKPIILSTGMNNIRSIQKSVNIIRKFKIPYALLHCTNIYPTPPKLVRLEAMLELKKNLKTQLLGYRIIQKQFIQL